MLATSSLSATLSAENTTNVAAFVAAVNAVQAYSSWVQGQSIPDPDLNNYLTQLKSDAIQWINVIYPLYLNMPNTVASQGSTIDNDLSTLISLAEQYQNSPSPALQTAINQALNGLISLVQGIASGVGALASDLANYYDALNGKDSGILQQAESQLQKDQQGCSAQLASNLGRLHQLQSATCPNQTAIGQCQQLVNQLQAQLQQYLNDSNELNQVAQSLGNAANGLQYLGGYWQQILADADQCVSSLQRAVNNTGVLLQLELQANLQNWNDLKSLLQQMYAGVAQFIH